MKKILLFLSIVLVFTACNSGGSPKATVDAMLTAMKNGNLDDMKKFITKKDIEALEAMEKLANAFNPDAVKQMREKMSTEFKEKASTAKYTLKDEKITGDNATVTAEVVEDGKTESHNFELKKEDGAWKISLFESGFGGDKGKMDEAMKNMNADSIASKMKQGMEALKNVNMDSVSGQMKEAMEKMKGPAGDSLMRQMKEAMEKMKQAQQSH